MSAVDRIRARLERQRSNRKVLTGDEAWALLDLADAAEKLRHPLGLGDLDAALTEVRQCRARLDGEEQ